MKRFVILLKALLFTMVLFSCNTERREISRAYRNFIESTVTFPEDMVLVKDSSLSVARINAERRRAVLYVDSSECSTCKIHSLAAYNRIAELQDDTGDFGFYIIFSPQVEYARNLMEDLMIMEDIPPVIVDANGSFRRSNRSIPGYAQMHFFLLDRSGRPVYVGDPLADGSLYKLFLKKLNDEE